MNQMSESTQPADPAPTSSEKTPASFADMKLLPDVQAALDDMGFTAPMEVQTAVYGPAMNGRDLMVQSRTGSGKTAAFGIPMVQRLARGGNIRPGVQALALAPTRELALQVAGELGKIGAHLGLQVAPVYGGAPMGRQVDALKAGAQIVAGTPGRVLDHIRRGTLSTSGLEILVLDECDEMLSMGFQEEIENIIKTLPPKEKRQTFLFSATIPEEIERIGKRHMREYDKITLSGDYIGVDKVDHQYYMVGGSARTQDLLKILRFEAPESAIIFCNTRDDTSQVARFLSSEGYDIEAISSDLSQSDRERVMGRMRAGNVQFLCATDIAARGIDIQDLECVINYTFPESPQVYVHRTGRTGRAGKSGVAISLVSPRELGAFYYLKLLYKIRPKERELPSEQDLKTRLEGERVLELADKVTGTPGDAWRSLARRVWQSSEGERIFAALLANTLGDEPLAAETRRRRAGRPEKRSGRNEQPAPQGEQKRASAPRREESSSSSSAEDTRPRREAAPARERDSGRSGRDRDRERDSERPRRGRDDRSRSSGPRRVLRSSKNMSSENELDAVDESSVTASTAPRPAARHRPREDHGLCTPSPPAKRPRDLARHATRRPGGIAGVSPVRVRGPVGGRRHRAPVRERRQARKRHARGPDVAVQQRAPQRLVARSHRHPGHALLRHGGHRRRRRGAPWSRGQKLRRARPGRRARQTLSRVPRESVARLPRPAKTSFRRLTLRRVASAPQTLGSFVRNASALHRAGGAVLGPPIRGATRVARGACDSHVVS